MGYDDDYHGIGCRSHWRRSARPQDRRGIFRLESIQKSTKTGVPDISALMDHPFPSILFPFLFGMVFQLSCTCMWEERWHLRAFGLVVQGEDRFAIEDTYAC
ncbi:hypothetical protein PSV08DRAFT_48213 [Bipolaris maydis]|uniref:uncharacterized protein n=1 Tax=Cochliobolus heterostrophus TaxID=5016 RepID=UPI0024DC35E6|nr:hypothetical protein J3E73DRAFT_50157 [Bipolaris maydis]KAJ6269763.1 hypothetical protein PSV08DRAFT_48213 [Bipolaris maydis]KAJ6280427.1 hypothetical protein J3E71DRAFT_46789 [Bipolaris maydis]